MNTVQPLCRTEWLRHPGLEKKKSGKKRPLVNISCLLQKPGGFFALEKWNEPLGSKLWNKTPGTVQVFIDRKLG